MHHTEAYDLQIKLFRGLPDESRLGGLEALRQDPAVFGRIVNTIRPPRSKTSSHLPCLHGRGFVAAKQGGLGRYSPPLMIALRRSSSWQTSSSVAPGDAFTPARAIPSRQDKTSRPMPRKRAEGGNGDVILR